MRLSCASSVKASGGLVINLLSNDVVRFEQVFMCLHYIWLTPIQGVIVSYFIYDNVGIAAMAGVFFMVLQTIPFQGIRCVFCLFLWLESLEIRSMNPAVTAIYKKKEYYFC